jgi:hypothetical protein
LRKFSEEEGTVVPKNQENGNAAQTIHLRQMAKEGSGRRFY